MCLSIFHRILTAKVFRLKVLEYLFIASYYSQLSADIEIKTGLNVMIFILIFMENIQLSV